MARETVTLEEAQTIIQAAQQKAQEIGQPMNIAIVDNGRQLKAFARMEDAWLGSIDISIDKAFTAASFPDFQTKDLAEVTQPGQPLYGLETTNGGRVVNFAGGPRHLLNFPRAEGYESLFCKVHAALASRLCMGRIIATSMSVSLAAPPARNLLARRLFLPNHPKVRST